MIEMPEYKPVPIPTKGENWWRRMVLVIFPRREYELTKDFYFIMTDGTRLRVRAPFRFDGSSVPIIFWWIPGFSPVGILLIQGIIHDAFYKRGFIARILDNGVVIFWGLGKGRKFGDVLFLQIGLLVNGVVSVGKIAYFFVRIGGWKAWRKHRQNETMP